MNSNMSGKAVKRLRFTADDELALLREFVNVNPLDDAEKWKDIHSNILLTTGKSFLIRTLKDHLFLILDVWLKKDKSNRIISGVEEIYSERDHLLQEVSDMCNKAKVVPLTKTKRITKEKQISNLGKTVRDECSERLKENMAMEVMQPEVLIRSPETSDHDYSIPSFHDEIEIAGNNDSDQNVYFPEPTIHTVDTPKTTTRNDSTAPRKILGPKRNRTNKSAPLRRSALDYLQNKEIREQSLKTRQLDLEQEKLNLEKRILILDEQRQEMDMNERKEKLEMERIRFKQEIFERDHTSTIITQQNNLIKLLIEKLNKYEEK